MRYRSRRLKPVASFLNSASVFLAPCTTLATSRTHSGARNVRLSPIAGPPSRSLSVRLVAAFLNACLELLPDPGLGLIAYVVYVALPQPHQPPIAEEHGDLFAHHRRRLGHVEGESHPIVGGGVDDQGKLLLPCRHGPLPS